MIFGKKLFYTVAPAEAPEKRDVVCLSTEDGKELWRERFLFTEYKIHRYNSFASNTPTVDNERVYVWWSDQDGSSVMALSHDGKRLWREKLGPFNSSHGSGSSLAVVDGVLLVQKENLNDSSFIAGLEGNTGKVLWKHPLPTKSKTPYVTPTVRKGAHGAPEAVFASTDHGLFALDPKKGTVNWSFDLGFEHRCVASPVLIGQDHFFVCSGNGGGKRDCVTIKAPIGKQAEKVYEVKRRGPTYPPESATKGSSFSSAMAALPPAWMVSRENSTGRTA